jgi:phosphoribosyl 1,2-cyclic phosphodiesterase
MIITFLGTGAANAFPEAFCKCENCAQARMLGGPSLRKRSAALINDDLLIDLGPDIMSASHTGRSCHSETAKSCSTQAGDRALTTVARSTCT